MVENVGPWPAKTFLWRTVRACLHEGGGPQVGEVTRLGRGNPLVHIISHFNLICLHDRWGDLPHFTSPIWGPPPPCKQALIQDLGMREGFQSQKYKTKEARLILQSGIYIYFSQIFWKARPSFFWVLHLMKRLS